MGILSNLLKATVKVALTPIGVLEDVGTVLDGGKPTATTGLIKGAVKDVGKVVKKVL